MSSLLKKKITHDKTVEITIPKNTLIYDLIVLQISNLVKDLRVVFPRDIVFKVLQDNIPVFQENKFKVIQYLSENISQDIKKLIIEKK